MNAPDKIYVRDFGDSLCQMWTHSPGKKKKDVDIVYLRKEAVLEIAKALKEEVGIGLSEYDAGHENGACEMINQVIEKINAL